MRPVTPRSDFRGPEDGALAQGARRNLLVLAVALVLLLSGVWASFLNSLAGLVLFSAGGLQLLLGLRGSLRLLRRSGPQVFAQAFQRSPGPVVVGLEPLVQHLSPADASACVVAALAAHFVRPSGGEARVQLAALRASILENFGPSLAAGTVEQTVAMVRERTGSLSPKERLESAVECAAFLRRSVANNPALRIRLLHEAIFRVAFLAAAETLLATGASELDAELFFEKLAARSGLDSELVTIIKRTAYYKLWSRQTEHAGAESDREEPRRAGRARKKPASAGDPFLDLVGLRQGADRETVRTAWKRVVLQYHPDRFHAASREEYRRAHERFVALQQAYQRAERQSG